jgi:hypothetical protein
MSNTIYKLNRREKMKTLNIIVVVILIIALLVIPIIPSQSCTDITTAEILGHHVASKTDIVCSPSKTSILAIFLKGLKSQ